VVPVTAWTRTSTAAATDEPARGTGATGTAAIERDLLAQVVQVSADAIFIEDLSGRITTWNTAAERLYGRPATEMVGSAAADLLPEQTAAHLRHVRDLALSGQQVERFDTWHQRPDGRHVGVSVTVSPLTDPDGTVIGLATSVQDVDERIRFAAELEDVHRTLEKQYDVMRRSNRDLEQFAYVASHDLSEPLRVMTGYVQLLERRYGDVLDERGKRYVHHVVDGAARMRTLIDDLLEYSRFLRSDDARRRIDLTAAARQVVATLGIGDVVVEELGEVWSDTASVNAVLNNLLGNAVKFARPDVPPKVVVTSHREGSTIVLAVDDNGIGIEPEYRERVFRMFQRLHVREAYEGTGIGLAIVQQVAETHGSRAWVEDSPLGGSRFCVGLPAAPTQRTPAT
jgi:PAS domain S-box-containing protein